PLPRPEADRGGSARPRRNRLSRSEAPMSPWSAFHPSRRRFRTSVRPDAARPPALILHDASRGFIPAISRPYVKSLSWHVKPFFSNSPRLSFAHPTIHAFSVAHGVRSTGPPAIGSRRSDISEPARKRPRIALTRTRTADYRV